MQNRPIISYGKIAESEVKFLELITIYAMLMNMPALTEDVGGGVSHPEPETLSAIQPNFQLLSANVSFFIVAK